MISFPDLWINSNMDFYILMRNRNETNLINFQSILFHIFRWITSIIFLHLTQKDAYYLCPGRIFQYRCILLNTLLCSWDVLNMKVCYTQLVESWNVLKHLFSLWNNIFVDFILKCRNLLSRIMKPVMSFSLEKLLLCRLILF